LLNTLRHAQAERQRGHASQVNHNQIFIVNCIYHIPFHPRVVIFLGYRENGPTETSIAVLHFTAVLCVAVLSWKGCSFSKTCIQYLHQLQYQ